MDWKFDGGAVFTATGLYDRVYTIKPDGEQYSVVETPYIKGRKCATLEDAKSHCRQQERSLAAG
ncbi:hypothetical protein BH11PLA2_BH11PLA2_47210 [soil metagenome]